MKQEKGNINGYIQELVDLQKKQPELGLLQFDNIISASQYRLLYELSQSYLPDKCRILDWGCGNGHFSYYLIQRGFDVFIYSLENLPPLLFGIDKNRFQFIQGSSNDPVTIPFADRSFNAVVSVGVLEHVRETEGNEAASLGEIRRILCSGGVFIGYHLPNITSWIEAFSTLIPKKHSHKWRYTQKALKRLLEDTGFDVKLLRRYGFLPRWAANRIPAKIKYSQKTADVYHNLDTFFVKTLPLFTTNHAVIASKAK